MLGSKYEHFSPITEREEIDFVHSSIHLDSSVLEYGSGRSTIELSRIAKSVVSVEHQKAWHEELSKELPKNVNLILAEPDLDYIEGPHVNQRSEGNDGTYEEFETYIKSPLDKAPYDVIIIDGRARVDCAKLCTQLAHEKSYIFVHDFEREEYQPILDILQKVDSVGRMFRFKLK
jgi:protein-L-isoaspartate O-methyltransferase